MAERRRADHEPPVEGGQVGEGEEARHYTGMIRGWIVLLRELGQGAANGHAGGAEDHNEEQAEGCASEELPEFTRPSDIRKELPEVQMMGQRLIPVIGHIHKQHRNSSLLGQHAEATAGYAQPELAACRR